MANRVLVYSTEPCRFCTSAKILLERRGVPYEEVNLARDPAGRQELAQRTGMMTFPQILIDGRPIGGFTELAQLDRQGGLDGLASPPAAA